MLGLPLIGLTLAATPPSAISADSAEFLWRDYARGPDVHAILPNGAYAGYRYGESDPPRPKVVVRVTDCGARGDGMADDTRAFQDAIRRAGETGGAVLVPAGVYRISDVLRLGRHRLVLRGEGPGKSIIAFDKSLGDLRGHGTRWSFKGGMIWGEWDQAGLPVKLPKVITAPVVKPAPAGSFRVEVGAEQARALQPATGEPVLIRWKGGLDLARHIFGGTDGEEAFLRNWALFRKDPLRFEWPNEITSVEGSQVVLKKPLRLDIRPGWEVTLGPVWDVIEEIGIEDLTIRFPEHERKGHLEDAGYNGIYLHGALHGWIRNVVIENADNGVFLERSSHVTLTGLKIAGGTCHHATSWRYLSHDNLMTDFHIAAQPHHGISCQDLASGNVWSNGVMEHGTLDNHCGMPFDSIRTNITIANCDGRAGGSESGGPFAGRRFVHWNIRVGAGRKKGLETFTRPSQFSLGALVGIQGAEIRPETEEPWHMPPGLKGTVIADTGRVPDPPDLYRAQLDQRLIRPARGVGGSEP